MAKYRKKFIDVTDNAFAVGDMMDHEDLLFSYKGILYPRTLYSLQTFKALESFEARREDVILAAYLKSGLKPVSIRDQNETTSEADYSTSAQLAFLQNFSGLGASWLGHILADLVTTAAENNVNETNSLDDEELEEFPYLEIGDTEKYQRMKKLSSRRVYLTNFHPQNLPESIFKNKAKILVLVRNPKDVATFCFHLMNDVSLFPSYETWDEFFTDFMTGKMPWGSYFDHICEWSKHVDDENVMTITYEELKENRGLGMKKIAEFFGLLLTEKQLQAVAEGRSFRAMKANIQKTHGALSKALFHKGHVNEWKNIFDEDKNQEMDKTFEERLARTKVGAKIKYEVYCKA